MKQELSVGIFQYELSSSVAKDCLKVLKKAPDSQWNNSRVGSNNYKVNIRSSQGLDLDFYYPQISQSVRKEFYIAVKDYLSYFDEVITGDEGFGALRYDVDDKYEYHSDGSWFQYRTVSALVYLNPDSYEGGETHFKHFNLNVKPKNPSIVLFPSNYPYLHAAMPVTKGTKYVLVTWMNDRS